MISPPVLAAATDALLGELGHASPGLGRSDWERIAAAVIEAAGCNVRGRPTIRDEVRAALVRQFEAGVGVLKASKAAGCGTSAAQRVRREWAAEREVRGARPG